MFLLQNQRAGQNMIKNFRETLGDYKYNILEMFKSWGDIIFDY